MLKRPFLGSWNYILATTKLQYFSAIQICSLWTLVDRRKKSISGKVQFSVLFSTINLGCISQMQRIQSLLFANAYVLMHKCASSLERNPVKCQDWREMGVLKKLCLPNATLFFLGQVKQLMFWAVTSLFQLFSRILCMAITQMYDKNFKDNGGNWI